MIKPIILLSSLMLSLHAEFHEAESESYRYEMAQKYCRDYQDGSWRVPHIKELFTLRGDQRFSRDRSFWGSNLIIEEKSRTSTGSEGEGLGEERFGYTFFLQDGDVAITPVAKQIGVICTNQPLNVSEPHYETTEEGIVDREGGILWHPIDAIDKKAKYTFEEARQFCETLEINGRTWRLPSLDELYGIVTYKRHRPTLDTTVFGHMMHRYYWSDDEFNEEQSYVVGFKLGSVATSNKKNRSYLRCVSDLEE